MRIWIGHRGSEKVKSEKSKGKRTADFTDYTEKTQKRATINKLDRINDD